MVIEVGLSVDEIVPDQCVELIAGIRLSLELHFCAGVILECAFTGHRYVATCC